MNSVLDTVLAALLFFSYKSSMKEKDELREQALLHLDRLRAGDEDPEAAAALFRDNVPMMNGQVVALYWPMQNEFDVRYIIDDLLRRDVAVALPITSRKTREMVFSLWDGKGDLAKGEFGVFIPPVERRVEPDIVVVPMLAFDRKGTRLGRGGGHYDTTLAALRQKRDILAVGVAYAAQAVLFNLPVEPHDQKLDMIITPKDVFDFRT